MSTRTKRSQSNRDRQFQEWLELYVEETGQTEIEMFDVAVWAVNNEHCDLPRSDALKQLAKQFSKSASTAMITGDDGGPVRKFLPYRETKGLKQQTFWSDIHDLSIDKMKHSVQLVRRQVRSTVIQAERNIEYFNSHINPGDPIQLSWNFDADIEESRMPSEYNDTPPSGPDQT